MRGNSVDGRTGAERWNECMKLLSARPRRQVVHALLRAPPEAQLTLPDAVHARDASVDADDLSVAMRHRHLPALADAGYVEWSADPLQVRRGPRFTEPASVVRTLLDAEDELAPVLDSGFVDDPSES